MRSIAPASRPHKAVRRPARESWIASAVPQDPAPRTAIERMALMRLVRAVLRLLVAGGLAGRAGHVAVRRRGLRRAAGGQACALHLHALLLLPPPRHRLRAPPAEMDRLDRQLPAAALDDDAGAPLARLRMQRARAVAAPPARALLLAV